MAGKARGVDGCEGEGLGFEGVSRFYPGAGGEPRYALRDVTFSVPSGRTAAVVGRSGSGKSTLLHLAAAIDVPSSGEVRVGGRALSALDEGERTLLRRDAVGLVFQFFHLLPHLSVLENVTLPSLIAAEATGEAERRAAALLDRVGLSVRARDLVHKLSGGEMQRVAICRALQRKPRLLLADEPTGNLDDATGRSVMELLLGLAVSEGSTVVFVTHSPEIAALADERLRLHDGSLEPDGGR